MESNIYIIANFNFGSRAAPANQVESFNNEIIKKWNTIIKNEDCIFVFGSIGGQTRKETREVLEKLNGKIYICNYNENKNFNQEDWLNWNVYRVWNTSFYYSLNDKIIFFPTKDSDIKKFPKYSDNTDNIYTIVWGLNEIDNVYKNKQLSIDAKYWDYTPILLNEIPDIILRMEEFEKMEG